MEVDGLTYSQIWMISSGKANAMLTASSNIVLCRYTHETTAFLLCIAKRDAYEI